YENLAGCLAAMGQAGRALPLYERALALKRRAIGEEHPDTAQAYDNVAGCLAAMGQASRALPLFEQALTVQRRALGEEHPHTAPSAYSVAYCLDRLNRLPEAIRLLQASLPAQEAARFQRAKVGFDRALTADRVSPHTFLALRLAVLKYPRSAFRH